MTSDREALANSCLRVIEAVPRVRRLSFSRDDEVGPEDRPAIMRAASNDGSASGVAAQRSGDCRVLASVSAMRLNAR